MHPDEQAIEGMTRQPNKRMQLTKPAQALELRSLSPVFGRLGLGGGPRKRGVPTPVSRAVSSRDRCLPLSTGPNGRHDDNRDA